MVFESFDFPQEFLLELIGVFSGFDGMDGDGDFFVKDSVAEFAFVTEFIFKVGVALLETGGIVRFE